MLAFPKNGPAAWFGKAAAGIGTAAALTAASHGVVLAHSNLVRSDPPANASLQQAPATVQLWFSEQPEVRLTTIQVFDANRREVEAGAAGVAAGDPLELVQRLQPGLPSGVYTVSWRTTSAVDGHVTGGAFAFGIGMAPGPAAATAAAGALPRPGLLTMALRWLEYLGADGLLGLALFVVLAAEPPALTRQGAAGLRLNVIEGRMTVAGKTLALLLLLSTFGALLDQARLSGGALSAVSLRAMLGTALGINLVLRIFLALAALALVFLRPAVVSFPGPPEYRSLGAAAAREMSVIRQRGMERPALVAALLAELLLFALSSHALGLASAPELALVNDWLHLTLAGVWTGGLLALAVAAAPEARGYRRPAAAGAHEDTPLFGPLARAFSRLALISAVGLLITGFYQAVVHVGSLDNALDTGYGQALMVKSAVFLAALLLAAYHRWLLLPALGGSTRATAGRARRFMARTLPVEGLLAAGILAATGVMTALPPANAAGSSTAQVTMLGDTRVVLDVVPLRVGSNLLQVTLKAHGRPVGGADKVELRLTMLDMAMGQSVVDLEPRESGVYAAETDALSMSGRWQIELLLRLPGQLDKRTSFDVTVKP